MALPDGYTTRHPRSTDATGVAALMTAADEEGGEEATASDIEREWRSLDLDHDVWVVEAPNGELAGYLETAKRGDDRLATDGYVDPGHTGRGVGGHLLDLMEQHAHELLDGSGVLSSATLDSNKAATALFESRGFRPVRHFFRMVIDLEDEPAPPVWPDGLEPRPFDLAHAEQFHAAIEEAFADEYGHIPEPFDAWRERRLEAPFTDTTLWLAVWDGDEIAATLMCDPQRFEVGWIGSVSTREPWRRRGLGLAMLRHAFVEFWRRGQRRVGLGVDAENPTGAVSLYERAGMRVLFDAVVYEKSLA